MSLDKYASEVERQIVRALVEDALASGCALSVWDGYGRQGEEVLTKSRDAAAIFAALCSTGYDTFEVHRGDEYLGNVVLVWGNDADLISDYHTNLEGKGVLERAEALAESLAG